MATTSDTGAVRSRPAIDGWFDLPAGADGPHLIGSRCGGCGTFVFPPRARGCPNPACDHDALDATPLSRTGTLWSYTENRYQPPPPYPQNPLTGDGPFEPYALAAVSLADEGLIVLGKAAAGTLAADLRVGMEMELAIEPLYVDEDGDERTVYVWRPRSQGDR